MVLPTSFLIESGADLLTILVGGLEFELRPLPMVVYVLMDLGAAEAGFWAVDQARLLSPHQAILH